MIDYQSRSSAYAWDSLIGKWVPFEREKISQEKKIMIWEFPASGWDAVISGIYPDDFDPEAEDLSGFPFALADWNAHPDQELIRRLFSNGKRMMYLASECSPEMLEAIGLSGHLIPATWMKHLRTGVGRKERPYVEAALVLSVVVFAHRAKNDGTRRYDADLPQLSYQNIAERTYLSRRAVKRAVDYLDDRGIIRKVLRNIVVKGTHYSNVLYIELYLDALEVITRYTDREWCIPL